MPLCHVTTVASSATKVASSVMGSSVMGPSDIIAGPVDSGVAPSSNSSSVAPSPVLSHKILPTPIRRYSPHPTKRLLRTQSLPVYTDGRREADGTQGPPGEGCMVMGDHGSGAFSDMLGPLPSEVLAEAKNDRGSHKARKATARDSRATLLQHYYPEGGWGWVVVFVATTMHVLNHGLHTGYGALLG
ncbi:hypothetical protein OTU49_006663, partial [Cherax quadricarinatus]